MSAAGQSVSAVAGGRAGWLTELSIAAGVGGGAGALASTMVALGMTGGNFADIDLAETLISGVGGGVIGAAGYALRRPDRPMPSPFGWTTGASGPPGGSAARDPQAGSRDRTGPMQNERAGPAAPWARPTTAEPGSERSAPAQSHYDGGRAQPARQHVPEEQSSPDPDLPGAQPSAEHAAANSPSSSIADSTVQSPARATESEAESRSSNAADPREPGPHSRLSVPGPESALRPDSTASEAGSTLGAASPSPSTPEDTAGRSSGAGTESEGHPASTTAETATLSTVSPQSADTFRTDPAQTDSRAQETVRDNPEGHEAPSTPAAVADLSAPGQRVNSNSSGKPRDRAEAARAAAPGPADTARTTSSPADTPGEPPTRIFASRDHTRKPRFSESAAGSVTAPDHNPPPVEQHPAEHNSESVPPLRDETADAGEPTGIAPSAAESGMAEVASPENTRGSDRSFSHAGAGPAAGGVPMGAGERAHLSPERGVDPVAAAMAADNRVSELVRQVDSLRNLLSPLLHPKGKIDLDPAWGLRDRVEKLILDRIDSRRNEIDPAAVEVSELRRLVAKADLTAADVRWLNDRLTPYMYWESGALSERLRSKKRIRAAAHLLIGDLDESYARRANGDIGNADHVSAARVRTAETIEALRTISVGSVGSGQRVLSEAAERKNLDLNDVIGAIGEARESAFRALADEVSSREQAADGSDVPRLDWMPVLEALSRRSLAVDSVIESLLLGPAAGVDISALVRAAVRNSSQALLDALAEPSVVGVSDIGSRIEKSEEYQREISGLLADIGVAPGEIERADKVLRAQIRNAVESGTEYEEAVAERSIASGERTVSAAQLRPEVDSVSNIETEMDAKVDSLVVGIEKFSRTLSFHGFSAADGTLSIHWAAEGLKEHFEVVFQQWKEWYPSTEMGAHDRMTGLLRRMSQGERMSDEEVHDISRHLGMRCFREIGIYESDENFLARLRQEANFRVNSIDRKEAEAGKWDRVTRPLIKLVNKGVQESIDDFKGAVSDVYTAGELDSLISKTIGDIQRIFLDSLTGAGVREWGGIVGLNLNGSRTVEGEFSPDLAFVSLQRNLPPLDLGSALESMVSRSNQMLVEAISGEPSIRGLGSPERVEANIVRYEKAIEGLRRDISWRQDFDSVVEDAVALRREIGAAVEARRQEFSERVVPADIPLWTAVPDVLETIRNGVSAGGVNKAGEPKGVEFFDPKDWSEPDRRRRQLERVVGSRDQVAEKSRETLRAFLVLPSGALAEAAPIRVQGSAGRIADTATFLPADSPETTPSLDDAYIVLDPDSTGDTEESAEQAGHMVEQALLAAGYSRDWIGRHLVRPEGPVDELRYLRNAQSEIEERVRSSGEYADRYVAPLRTDYRPSGESIEYLVLARESGPEEAGTAGGGMEGTAANRSVSELDSGDEVAATGKAASPDPIVGEVAEYLDPSGDPVVETTLSGLGGTRLEQAELVYRALVARLADWSTPQYVRDIADTVAATVMAGSGAVEVRVSVTGPADGQRSVKVVLTDTGTVGPRPARLKTRWELDQTPQPVPGPVRGGVAISSDTPWRGAPGRADLEQELLPDAYELRAAVPDRLQWKAHEQGGASGGDAGERPARTSRNGSKNQIISPIREMAGLPPDGDRADIRQVRAREMQQAAEIDSWQEKRTGEYDAELAGLRGEPATDLAALLEQARRAEGGARLVVGGGHAYRAAGPGEVFLNRRPDVAPDVVADFTDLSELPAEVFSSVYFERVGVEELPRAVSELYRVLAPGGHLVISTDRDGDRGMLGGSARSVAVNSLKWAGFENIDYTVVRRDIFDPEPRHGDWNEISADKPAVVDSPEQERSESTSELDVVWEEDLPVVRLGPGPERPGSGNSDSPMRAENPPTPPGPENSVRQDRPLGTSFRYGGRTPWSGTDGGRTGAGGHGSDIGWLSMPDEGATESGISPHRIDPENRTDAELLGAPGADEWSLLTPPEVGARLRSELAGLSDGFEVEVFGFDDPGLNSEVVREYARGLVDMASRHPQVDICRVGFVDMVSTGWANASFVSDHKTGKVGCTVRFNSGRARSAVSLAQTMRTMVEQGRYYPGPAQRPAYSVSVHEFGHAIDRAGGGTATALIGRALVHHYVGHRSGETTVEGFRAWLRANLSEYSLASDGLALIEEGEAVAEAFTDVTLRGRDRVGAPARLIYDILIAQDGAEPRIVHPDLSNAGSPAPEDSSARETGIVAPAVPAGIRAAPLEDAWSLLGAEAVGEKLQSELRRILRCPNLEVTGFDRPGLDPMTAREYARGLVETARRFPDVNLRAIGIDDLPAGVVSDLRSAVDPRTGTRYIEGIRFDAGCTANPHRLRQVVLGEHAGFGGSAVAARPAYAIAVQEFGRALDVASGGAVGRRFRDALADHYVANSLGEGTVIGLLGWLGEHFSGNSFDTYTSVPLRGPDGSMFVGRELRSLHNVGVHTMLNPSRALGEALAVVMLGSGTAAGNAPVRIAVDLLRATGRGHSATGVHGDDRTPPDASRFPSLGAWYGGIRRHLGLTREELGARLEANAETVRRWEGSTKIELGVLRLMRDIAGISDEQIHIAIENFSTSRNSDDWRQGAENRRDPKEMEAMFWELIDTRSGSEAEQLRRRRILTEYRFTDSAGHSRSLDGLVQEEMRIHKYKSEEKRARIMAIMRGELLKAISGHHPLKGTFAFYATSVVSHVSANAESMIDRARLGETPA